MDRKLSRRGFLQQSMLTTAGTTLGSLPLVVAAQGIGAASGDGFVADAERSAHGLIGITLEVNGSARVLEVEPRATLAGRTLPARDRRTGCRGTSAVPRSAHVRLHQKKMVSTARASSFCLYIDMDA